VCPSLFFVTRIKGKEEKIIITESMELITYKDAQQWASSFGIESDAGIEKLAEWIWANKVGYRDSFSKHPVSQLNDVDFWNIVEGN